MHSYLQVCLSHGSCVPGIPGEDMSIMTTKPAKPNKRTTAPLRSLCSLTALKDDCQIALGQLVLHALIVLVPPAQSVTHRVGDILVGQAAARVQVARVAGAGGAAGQLAVVALLPPL